MENFSIRIFRESDRAAVKYIWQKCNLTVPLNDPDKDIDLKTAFQPDLFFVGESGSSVVAAIMAGYDGHRGYLNYVGVLPEYQKKGFGRIIVGHAVAALRERGCPKVNISVRTSNNKVTAFYEKIGFVRDEVIGMGYRF